MTEKRRASHQIFSLGNILVAGLLLAALSWAFGFSIYRARAQVSSAVPVYRTVDDQCEPFISMDLYFNNIVANDFCQDSVTIRVFQEQGGELLFQSSVPVAETDGTARLPYRKHNANLTPGIYLQVIGDQNPVSVSLTVPPLGITEIDFPGQAILGFGPPDQVLAVEAGDCNDNVLTSPDGVWEHEFSGCEFSQVDGIWVNISGGLNEINYSLPVPLMEVNWQTDSIEGYNFFPHGQIHMQVLDEPGGEVIFERPDIVLSRRGRWVLDRYSSAFDLLPGMVLSVTEMQTGRQVSTTVANLAKTGFDFPSLTMSGTSQPNAELEVGVSQRGDWYYDTITAGHAGNWSVDMSSTPVERAEFFTIYVVQYDLHGNDTYVSLHPDREISADLAADEIVLKWFEPATNMTLKIYGFPGGTLLYSGQLTTDSLGSFILGRTVHGVDLLPGMQITAVGSSEGIDESLVMVDIGIHSIDQLHDVVEGVAPPGTYLTVNAGSAQSDSQSSKSLRPVVDNAGSWKAYFGAASIEISYDTVLRAFAYDVDGDRTVASLSAQPEFCEAVTQISSKECDALAAIYQSTAGDNWSNKNGWLSSLYPCSWFGVSCNADDQVVGLNLTANNLAGTLPSNIGDLSHLVDLYLGWNQLSSLIPYSITLLYDLETLSLGHNSLSSPNQEVVDFVAAHESHCSPLLEVDMNHDSIRSVNFCQAAVTVDIYDQQDGELWISQKVPIVGNRAALPYRKHSVDLREGVHLEVSGDQDHTSLSLTLPDLRITEISFAGQYIAGTGPQNSDLVVEAGDCTGTTHTSTLGDWRQDFTPICPLSQLSDIWVGYMEGDLQVSYGQLSARMEVNSEIDEISGFYFFPQGPVSLQVLDGPGGEVLLEPEEFHASPRGTWVLDRYSGVMDLQPGMVISATERQTGQQISTTVDSLQKTSVDSASMTMSGTAVENAQLQVGVQQFGDWYYKYISTDENGDWSVNMSSTPVDPEKYYLFYLARYDERGSDTYVALHPNQEITADLAADDITLKWFEAGITLTVSVYQSPGGTLLYSGLVTLDSLGSFVLGRAVHGIDLLPGMRISVENPSLGIAESLELVEVTVDSLELQDDVAAGSAPAGTYLHVSTGAVQSENLYIRTIRQVVGSSGGWQANFGAASIDLLADTEVRAYLYDSDGDRTQFSRVPSFCEKTTGITAAECEALTAFYSSSGGDGWINQSGWLTSNTPCSWYGITCSSGHVSKLELPHNNLSGSLSPEISSLSGLVQLDVQGNKLGGALPASCGYLSQLTLVNLAENQLGGVLPSSLTNLTAMTNLDLGYNKFSATDSGLVSFLQSHDPDWQDTQTVPPSGLSVSVNSPDAADLFWSPIPYTGDGGNYEVYYAGGSGSPFQLQGTTASKLSSSYPFSGLSPDTLYTFYLRTYTPAHGTQLNDLWSDDSADISYQYTSLPAGQDETVIFEGTQGVTTTLDIPAGALTEPTTLTFADTLDTTPPAGFQFAGTAFEITASQGGVLLDQLIFEQPVELSLEYADEDVSGLDENNLLLHVWDDDTSQWIDAAHTCTPTSAYQRDPGENWLRIPICHLSQFALYGNPLLEFFLPVIFRP